MEQFKVYILQKDLPDSKAGDEYVWNITYGRYYKNNNLLDKYWEARYVENNPEWFKLKEEEQPEDVFVWNDSDWIGVIKNIRLFSDYKEAAEYLVKQLNIIMLDKQSKSTQLKPVPPSANKVLFDGSKEDLYIYVKSNDNLNVSHTELEKYYWEKVAHKYDKMIPQQSSKQLYTKYHLNDARREAFNMARSHKNGTWIYETFDDYLKILNE